MLFNTNNTRDYSLDNIRFFLIFGVVFAHFLEICDPFLGSTYLYKLIYSFHMPAFIFLFGYNVKYSLEKIIYRWCIPYIVFQYAYILFVRSILNTDLEFQYTTPYWLLWYMMACIFYQVTLPLFNFIDKRRQIIALLCVFIISLVIGFDDSVGYYMSLSRFFVFQPWFLLGYYCKINGVIDNISIKSERQFKILLISIIFIIFITPISIIIPNGILYGSYSYANCGGTLWMRIIVYLISFAVISFLFVGIKTYLNKKIIIITHIGQNTWPIFLLHGFLVKLVKVYSPHLLNSFWQVLIITFVILVAIGNTMFNKIVYFVSLSWIEKHNKNIYDK